MRVRSVRRLAARKRDMANIDDANSRCILLRFGFRFCALLAFVSPIGAGVYLTFAAFIKLRAELPNGRTIPALCDIHPRHPHGNANKCPAAIYCRRSLRACRDAYARNNEAREGFGIRERARGSSLRPGTLPTSIGDLNSDESV